MNESGCTVGLVTPSYPPRIGGVEAHVAQLARGLSELGCDVCVLTQVRRDDPAGATVSIEGDVEVRRFRDVTRSTHFEVAPSLARGLWRARSEFDIIHAHSFHGVPALAAAFLTSSPFIFTPHYHGVGHTTMAKLAHVAYDPLAEVIFRRATSVICVSDAEAKLLTEDYPRARSRIAVIPNGVDRDSIEVAVPFPNDRPVLLVVGRLESYKQVDRVVRAVSHLPEGPELVIVGDGPVRTDLERLALEVGGECTVRFAGRVETAILRRWQRTAEVTVCMSRHEAYGMVLAEAVAAGSAVVASDIAAHREVAANVGGRVTLVSPDLSEVDLAVAIEKALTSTGDPSVGPVVPTWNEISERTLTVYRNALRSTVQT